MYSPERLLQKRLQGERLTPEEGVSLYACDLLTLGAAACALTRQLIPDRRVTYIVDRNISYTNACIVDCGFCAFHRPPGADGVFTLSHEQIFQKIRELVDAGGTQVLIQGGLNPDLDLEDYLGLIRAVREKFPGIHIHSFSVVEMDYLASVHRMPVKRVLALFKESGLNSLPGGGAEILVERVRERISPRKVSAGRWLEVMRKAHEIGLKSTATMVFGHIETLGDRIAHMVLLRRLQDETGGFRAFIPWSLSPRATPRMSAVRPAGGQDYLKTVAVARLMLDNFVHIQSGWLTEGLKLAQAALDFGCDDMGGTLMEDKVLEPTGACALTRKEQLIGLIRQAGYEPAQRDTNYEIIRYDSV